MKHVLSFIACAVLILAASVGVGAAETAAPEVTELRYVTGLLESADAEAQVDAQIAQFHEAHPEIRVNRQAVDYEQMQTLIQTRIQSGDVDIFQVDAGPAFGGALSRAGLLADMGPAYERYGWQPFDWALTMCTHGGVIVCHPDSVEEMGIFYNKTMFDERGMSEPETLEELIGIMDAFKAEGITPMAFGNQPQWPGGHLWSIILSAMVGGDGLDARLAGELPWNDDAVVRSIELGFRDFLEAGYYPRDPNAITYEDAADLFYSGQAAMLPTGTWLIYDIVDRADFDVEFMPFPSIGGAPIAPAAGLGAAIGVAATSDRQDAAFTFIDWLYSDAVLREWALPVYNVIPAQPVDSTGLDLPPLLVGVIEDLSGREGPLTDFGYNIDVLTPGAFIDQIYIGLQEVMGGAITPQQQADRLQEAYQEGLAAGETIER